MALPTIDRSLSQQIDAAIAAATGYGCVPIEIRLGRAARRRLCSEVLSGKPDDAFGHQVLTYAGLPIVLSQEGDNYAVLWIERRTAEATD